MAGHGTKLGRKREDAIAGLLSQRNVDEAARAAGVGARTLWRWLQDSEFQTAYRKAKRAVFGQSLARLQQASGAAAAVVLKIMLDPTTPAATRLKAADIVFARAAQAMELEDVEARVSELESVARRRRSKAVDGRGVVSPFMGQLRQLEGQSSVIRPAPKAKSEHGIALTREPKEISERQKLCCE
jgi:hypothetical protein